MASALLNGVAASARSTMRTAAPLRASRLATASPTGPAPATRTEGPAEATGFVDAMVDCLPIDVHDRVSTKSINRTAPWTIARGGAILGP